MSQLLPGFIKGKLVRDKIKINDALSKDYVFKIATDREELEQAYELVYQSYRRKGYLGEDPSGIRLLVQHAHPQAVTFVGKLGDEVMITMSLFPDSVLGLPMDDLFKTELDVLRRRKRAIAEVGSLASSPKVRSGRQQLPMMMNNIMHRYARHHLGIDDLVITVNPAHEFVYRHSILFRRIGRNKAYDKVNGHMAVPLRLDLRKYKERHRQVYRGKKPSQDLYDFFHVRHYPNIELPADHGICQVYDRGLFDYFFEQRSDMISQIDPGLQMQLYLLYLENDMANTVLS